MERLRICAPIEATTVAGGFQFLRSFLAFCERRGVGVTADPLAAYDVVFLNSWQVTRRTLAICLRANPGATVVHRVDGAAQGYGRTDGADRVQAEVNAFAALTIFQSEYARNATRERFRVIAGDGPVLHNPVDVETFAPEGEREPELERPAVAYVTWSTNPNKGAADLYRTAAENPDTHFYLAGNFPDAPSLPNLHARGVLGRAELARLLRSCDALLTYSRNEACPNHVLEALACGTPVLYLESGATPELVGECGVGVSVPEFRAGLERVLASGVELRERTRARAVERFHPDRILGEYLRLIHDRAERRTRAAPVRPPRSWAAFGRSELLLRRALRRHVAIRVYP